MSKTAVIKLAGALVSFIFLFLDATYNINFGDGVEGQVVEWVSKGIAGAWTAWGIFMTHDFKKKKDTL